MRAITTTTTSALRAWRVYADVCVCGLEAERERDRGEGRWTIEGTEITRSKEEKWRIGLHDQAEIREKQMQEDSRDRREREAPR